ncbi:MAG: extracellular solute-binding protein, partial [Treponema sp.]|nr:extracellular solute-binding protein [Treponema sp.]
APRIAVGNVPDFMAITVGPQDHAFLNAMVNNRELMDLTPFFNTQAPDRPAGTRVRDAIIPGMLDTTMFAPYGDGRIFIAPFNAGPMGPVYNVDLFNRMGWTPPATWDQWFAMDALLNNPDNYVTIGGSRERRSIFTYQGIHPGYLESILWPAIASAGGVEAIRRIETYQAGSWDNPAVRAVLTNFARMGASYLMPGTVGLNHTQSQADMLLGRALFIPNGVWFVEEMAGAPREPGFEFAIAPVPTISPGQPRFVLSSAEQFTIPAAARNPEMALEFLRFLYTDESIRAFAREADGSVALLGARDIARNQLSPSVYNMLRAYDEGHFMLMSFAPIPPGLPISMGVEVFNNRITPLMTGEVSVDEYIQSMEALNAQIRAHIAAN